MATSPRRHSPNNFLDLFLVSEDLELMRDVLFKVAGHPKRYHDPQDPSDDPLLSVEGVYTKLRTGILQSILPNQTTRVLEQAILEDRSQSLLDARLLFLRLFASCEELRYIVIRQLATRDSTRSRHDFTLKYFIPSVVLYLDILNASSFYPDTAYKYVCVIVSQIQVLWTSQSQGMYKILVRDWAKVLKKEQTRKPPGHAATKKSKSEGESSEYVDDDEPWKMF